MLAVVTNNQYLNRYSYTFYFHYYRDSTKTLTTAPRNTKHNKSGAINKFRFIHSLLLHVGEGKKTNPNTSYT